VTGRRLDRAVAMHLESERPHGDEVRARQVKMARGRQREDAKWSRSDGGAVGKKLTRAHRAHVEHEQEGGREDHARREGADPSPGLEVEGAPLEGDSATRVRRRDDCDKRTANVLSRFRARTLHTPRPRGRRRRRDRQFSVPRAVRDRESARERDDDLDPSDEGRGELRTVRGRTGARRR
jgi:hypothetical protein